MLLITCNEAWLHNKCHKIYLSGRFGIFYLYVILTISYLRAQTIETSSLPTDSSRPLFKQIEIFSGILTVYFICKYFPWYTRELLECHIDMCMKHIDLLVENNVQPILVFGGMELEAKANVESFRKRWGHQQVSGDFLVVLVRINSVLSVRYFLPRYLRKKNLRWEED